MIRCLIIDDEPSSQNLLEAFVDRIPFLELSGICNNAIEALEFLNETAVDLLFLDINMPQLTGISFYKSLRNPPKVIFTTAYSEHAVEGFDLNAVDYLLKPFSFERFVQAISKVKLQGDEAKDSIVIKADKKLHQIKTSEIHYVESLGDYVKVHLMDKTLITYKTLKKIIEELPNSSFVQIHKSYVVNRQKIEFVEGNSIVIGTNRVPLGQKFKKDFLTRFNS